MYEFFNSQNTPQRSKLPKIYVFQNDLLAYLTPSSMLEFSKLVQIHAFKLHSLHYLSNHLQTQNLVKCQGTLRIKTQSIRKIDRKIYQTKHLSNLSPNCSSFCDILKLSSHSSLFSNSKSGRHKELNVSIEK